MSFLSLYHCHLSNGDSRPDFQCLDRIALIKTLETFVVESLDSTGAGTLRLGSP